MPSKTFLIQSEGLGRGDDQLGLILMARSPVFRTCPQNCMI
jgi:hypothetical protein